MRLQLLSLAFLLVSAKTNAQKFEWVKGFGGNYYDNGYAITTDAAGNIYATGSFVNKVDFDPNAGKAELTAGSNDDVFVTKFSPAGNLIWARKLGGNGYDIGRSIAVDKFGNVYTTGSFESTADFNPGAPVENLIADGFSDIFISKLDSSGSFVWALKIGAPATNEAGAGIAVDAAGDYIYCTGSFSSTMDFDPDPGSAYNITPAGSDDIFILKLSNAGGLNWVRKVGSGGSDISESIAVDSKGDVYTTGYFGGTVDFDPSTTSPAVNLTSNGNTDIFILKLNTVGSFQWAKSMGSPYLDKGKSITVKSGYVYTTGTLNGLADFDPGDGTYDLNYNGNIDAFISKLDADGKFVWARNLGGTLDDRAYAITVDKSGSVYTTGDFNGTADFNPSTTSVTTLTSAGQTDAYVSKLDANGNYVWAKNMGSTSYDIGKSIVVDESGTVYTLGNFRETVNFNAGTSATLTATGTLGGDDMFILKMSQEALGLNDNATASLKVTIFPNPGTGVFNVVLPEATEGSIEVYNSLGMVVHRQTAVPELNRVELSNQSNGLYFVKVIAGNRILASQQVLKK